MNNNVTLDLILRDFGRRKGVMLSTVATGATAITDTKGNEYWIEAPKKSPLIIIHTQFGKMSASQISPNEIRKMLILNSHQHLMKGAWISMNQKINMMRLCTAIPISATSIDVLDNVFSNLVSLSKEINIYYQTIVS